MSKEQANKDSRVYQRAVTAAGMCLWLVSAASILRPLVAGSIDFCDDGAWNNHHRNVRTDFRLPLGARFTQERLTFTLTDAFVLLVACWFGTVPAIFLAGIEGFTSSRHTARRLSSNLFSSSMMSLGCRRRFNQSERRDALRVR